MFPHYQPTAATVKSDDEEKSGTSSEEESESKPRGRQKNKGRGKGGRSKSPTASVCFQRPGGAGSRSGSPVAVITRTSLKGDKLEWYHLGLRTKTGGIKFGLVEIFARPTVRGETLYPYEQAAWDPNYRHKKPRPDPAIAAERAVNSAQDLIKELAQDSAKDAQGKKPPDAEKKVGAEARATPVCARNEWVIDSGSSFDISSPSDTPGHDKKNIYNLVRQVTMHTADGEASAEQD